MTNTTEIQSDGMADPGRIPKVTPEDVLAEFTEQEDRAEPMTAPELAEALDCSRRTALNKLHTLEEEGDVASKKVGGRSKVWWVPLTDGERAPTDGRESDVREPGDRTGETLEDAVDGQDAEATLRELDLPGSGAKLDGRIEAVLRLYEHLKDHAGEPVSRRELLDHVDADAVGYASRESFWNNFVKANSSQGRETNALVALPGVEEWGDGEYRYDP
jgi:biotin operon repressor